MVLFIVLFSVLLAPFQCNLHPNGSYTVKRYPTVFCDGTGQHAEMFWLGGFACLMPISFLVVCSYVVLVEMPKRVAKSDAAFLAAISFLTKRFRPGMEMSSVWLLVRNAAVVATPLLYTTAAQLLMMSISALFEGLGERAAEIRIRRTARRDPHPEPHPGGSLQALALYVT